MHNDYFPQIMGTEEETRFFSYKNNTLKPIIFTKSNSDSRSEAAKINLYLSKICRPLIAEDNINGDDLFLENGSRSYVDQGGIELATPETKSPEDSVKYIKANALLYERAMSDYLQDISRRKHEDITVMVQRRVIDQSGSTIGHHDNLSFQNSSDIKNKLLNSSKGLGLIWVNYLYSRNFINGSMMIDESGALFSQKLSQSHNFDEYNYVNSLLRIDHSHGNRLEIRCNDINLQDWSVVSRLGGDALILAASQTALANKLAQVPYYLFEWLQYDNSWNKIPVDKDNNFHYSPDLQANIDLQRFYISTILEELEDYMNQAIPDTYKQIGQSILKYCDDIEEVMYGKKKLEDLMNRVDWAVKLYAIQKKMADNPTLKLGDARTKLLDMRYDQIKFDATAKGDIAITHGYGYKMADKTALHSPKQIEDATTTPPEETRAAQRVQLAKCNAKQLIGCNWHYLTLEINGLSKKIELDKLVS